MLRLLAAELQAVKVEDHFGILFGRYRHWIAVGWATPLHI